MELKAKEEIQLKGKGDKAYIAVKQLMVSLKWNDASMDFDLMAFYTGQDGTIGGCYSDEISKDASTLGSMNSFPHMQLSGDDMGGDGGGEETLRIVNLEPMKSVNLVVMNYTDASQGKASSFSAYDVSVTIMDDGGNTTEVKLDNGDSGTVAVLASIELDAMGSAQMINKNEILDLAGAVANIPGFKALLA